MTKKKKEDSKSIVSNKRTLLHQKGKENVEHRIYISNITCVYTLYDSVGEIYFLVWFSWRVVWLKATYIFQKSSRQWRGGWYQFEPIYGNLTSIRWTKLELFACIIACSFVQLEIMYLLLESLLYLYAS